jgi:hypothetical protein
MTSSWFARVIRLRSAVRNRHADSRLGQLGHHLPVENVPVLPGSEKAKRSFATGDP